MKLKYLGVEMYLRLKMAFNPTEFIEMLGSCIEEIAALDKEVNTLNDLLGEQVSKYDTDMEVLMNEIDRLEAEAKKDQREISRWEAVNVN